MSLLPVRVVAKENLAGSYTNGVLSYVKPEEGAPAGTVLKVDNVELNAGDSVLLAFQTNPAENGVYLVDKGGLEWSLSRREDNKSAQLMIPGLHVCVAAGDVGAGSCWTLIEPAPKELGKDNVLFASGAEKSPVPAPTPPPEEIPPPEALSAKGHGDEHHHKGHK